VVLSDGDVVLQPRKISVSGIADAGGWNDPVVHLPPAKRRSGKK
jgi:hypothetical protein